MRLSRHSEPELVIIEMDPEVDMRSDPVNGKFDQIFTSGYFEA